MCRGDGAVDVLKISSTALTDVRDNFPRRKSGNFAHGVVPHAVLGVLAPPKLRLKSTITTIIVLTAYVRCRIEANSYQIEQELHGPVLNRLANLIAR
jgi:hypothetical protein